MNLIDLVLLAGIGVFIYVQFFSHKLPKDLHLKQKKPAKSAKATGKVLEFPKTPAPELDNQDPLSKIRAADPDFRPAEFLKGIEKAYRFYVQAFNAKDTDALEKLFAPQLVQDFDETFAKLDDKGHNPAFELVKFGGVEVLDARLNGRTAIVDVQLTLEQSENYHKADGKLVGKAKPAQEVKILWTLARPLDADDPNWEVDIMTKPS